MASDEHDLILERPTLHKLGATYILDWDVSKVRAQCRNIREHSDSLTSEITWTFWTGERWAILYRSQMNLNSPTTRGSISKALAERAKFPFNWRAAVDQLCILVPDSWRAGEPFVGLNDVEMLPEPPFLVERLLPEENATVVYGDGQAGKSFFAMGVALAVATGKPVGGRWKVARAGPVLYLDWETSKGDQALRMRRMGADTEFGPGPWPISYRRMTGPLADQVEAIMEWVQERNVALVIYDSLGWATGDELKEAGPAIRVMEATRAIGPTALILAHVTKDEAKKSGQGGPATIFGSKYFELAARYTWHITSTQDELDGIEGPSPTEHEGEQRQAVRPPVLPPGIRGTRWSDTPGGRGPIQ